MNGRWAGSLALSVLVSCGATGPASPTRPDARPATGGIPRAVAPGVAYSTPTISIRESSKALVVDVAVQRRAASIPPQGVVSISTEPVNVGVPFSGTEVDEANMFGTGLVFDLDGDGEATSRLPFSCEGDEVVLGASRYSPVAEESVFEFRHEDGTSKVSPVTPDGAVAMLYRSCAGGTLSMGFAVPGQAFGFVEEPSPALGLLVLEEVEVPVQPAAYSFASIEVDSAPVDARSFRASSFEAIEEDHRRWYEVSWVLLPLNRDKPKQSVSVELTFSATEPRRAFVLANINEAGPGIDRFRGPTAIVELPPS